MLLTDRLKYSLQPQVVLWCQGQLWGASACHSLGAIGRALPLESACYSKLEAERLYMDSS